MKVIWSDPALKELASIQDYIAKDSPLTAENFTIGLYNQISDRLKEFPRYGRKIPEIDQDAFREVIYRNYRIMNRIKKEGLSILSVRNSRRLFKSTFR